MSPQQLAGTLAPEQARSGLRRFLTYLGPATLVSVGYMDPGNWATDIEGGARFGHQLLWVLVVANGVALLMQTLAARLGIVARLDLAQACRACYPRPVVHVLLVLCEIAIIACDLAEVLGSAVALNLLFGIPLVWGAVVTLSMCSCCSRCSASACAGSKRSSPRSCSPSARVSRRGMARRADVDELRAVRSHRVWMRQASTSPSPYSAPR